MTVITAAVVAGKVFPGDSENPIRSYKPSGSDTGERTQPELRRGISRAFPASSKDTQNPFRQSDAFKIFPCMISETGNGQGNPITRRFDSHL